jgi:GTPase SAR1 family protein
MADRRVKIVVVGPKRCGKTVLANIFSGTTDVPDDEYTPTTGVRFACADDDAAAAAAALYN